MAFTTNYRKISYTEVGYSESTGPEGTVGKRTIQTRWTNYNQVPGDFVGTHSLNGQAGGAGAVIVRTLPEQHPDKPWLWARDCEMVRTVGAPIERANGLGADYQEMPANAAGKVEWLITYVRPPYDIVTDQQAGGNELKRYVQRKSSYTVESIQTPGRGWKWDDGATPANIIQEPGVFLLGCTQLEYKWMFVPTGAEVDATLTLRESKWAQYQGRVNNAVFDTVKLANGAGATVETVLFMGWDKEGPFADPDGHEVWHVTFNLILRPQTWNQFYRRRIGASPRFEAVVSNEDGVTKPYGSFDLNALFNVSS